MLTDRCKPGDKALIIPGRNAGRLVLVCHALPPGETRVVLAAAPHYNGLGTIWHVESLGGPLLSEWLVSGKETRAMTALCPDAWLQPLPPLPEEQIEQSTTHDMSS